ncbi:hypothetical protein J3R30DRAFT_3735574 [Lentinula aciculospora]|uniref:Bromo domain-containing protein n=1 Tax=Lentinula aciculospora TaxID=153920 RepID=A0A9W9A6K8_9AGAR|nr:hypothetical protein J3R30DRAFT_3735574 [Lentinula aciculospora]
MSLNSSQKSSITSVLDALLTAVATPPSKAKPGDIGVGGTGIGTGRGRKRVLSGMFLILLDRNDWAEYYDLIPNPRALHPIRDALAENKYTDALDVYTDLSLVFWNAIFYNERESQISKDAAVLKNLLDIEWAKRTDLPQPRSRSPPPGSAQKTYPEVEEKEREKEREIERQKEIEREKEKEANAKNIEVQVIPAPQLPQVPYQPQPTPNPASDIIDLDVDVPDTESETDQTDDEAEADDEDEYDGIDDDIIVCQLENSLPRWPGFDDNEGEGWLAEGNAELYLSLIHAVKGYKDVIGNRLATVLEAIPEVIDGPTSSKKERPISIKAIESRIKSKAYSTAASFDKDMMLLFEKGRRWWEPLSSHFDASSFKSDLVPSGKPKSVYGGSKEEYAKILILQRLYQSLTSPYLPDRPKPDLGLPYTSETNFAGLSVGPGRPIPRIHQNLPENEEVLMVASGSQQIYTITGNRVFLDQAKYKGWTIRVGDWVHLANGCDARSGTGGSAGRPIVAQVWKVWQRPINNTNAIPNGAGSSGGQNEYLGRGGEYGITVCWYYRPEETFHSPQRVFWENEVFKSNHFASHPLSDIIEPIFVQHTRAHIRGRPRTGWYPGWPIYVCDSRYSYSKGYKNYRNRARGLATRSTTKPIFIRIKNCCLPPEISIQLPQEGQRSIYSFEKTVFPTRRASPFVVGGGGPGGIVEDGVPGSVSGPTKGALIGSAEIAKSVANALQYLQQYATQSLPYSQPYQNYTQSVPTTATATATAVKPSKPDRTSTAYAMAQTQGVQVEFSILPKNTTRHFSRDPSTGSLLWFPSAPANVPGRAGNAAGTTGYTGFNSRVKVGYTLEYLHWRAMKMKSAKDIEEDVNRGKGSSAKRVLEVDRDETNGWNSEVENSDTSTTRRKPKRSRSTAIETLAEVSKGA